MTIKKTLGQLRTQSFFNWEKLLLNVSKEAKTKLTQFWSGFAGADPSHK